MAITERGVTVEKLEGGAQVPIPPRLTAGPARSSRAKNRTEDGSDPAAAVAVGSSAQCPTAAGPARRAAADIAVTEEKENDPAVKRSGERGHQAVAAAAVVRLEARVAGRAVARRLKEVAAGRVAANAGLPHLRRKSTGPEVGAPIGKSRRQLLNGGPLR